jgi:hypothetical protein
MENPTYLETNLAGKGHKHQILAMAFQYHVVNSIHKWTTGVYFCY